MKILHVIHGYPMRYNAGSEVYTQGLAQALAERHEVHVFTRQENAFSPEYFVQRDTDSSAASINLHVINMARARDGYRHQAVDNAFGGSVCFWRTDYLVVGMPYSKSKRNLLDGWDKMAQPGRFPGSADGQITPVLATKRG